jgi:hypothetical protein
LYPDELLITWWFIERFLSNAMNGITNHKPLIETEYCIEAPIVRSRYGIFVYKHCSFYKVTDAVFVFHAFTLRTVG